MSDYLNFTLKKDKLVNAIQFKVRGEWVEASLDLCKQDYLRVETNSKKTFLILGLSYSNTKKTF